VEKSGLQMNDTLTYSPKRKVSFTESTKELDGIAERPTGRLGGDQDLTGFEQEPGFTSRVQALQHGKSGLIHNLSAHPRQAK